MLDIVSINAVLRRLTLKDSPYSLRVSAKSSGLHEVEVLVQIINPVSLESYNYTLTWWDGNADPQLFVMSEVKNAISHLMYEVVKKCLIME